jgi:hypothetical protein
LHCRHVREPHRGSAYRSLSGGHKLDPVIARAGEAAGLQAARLESMLAHTSGITVFVNPGEVKTVRAGKQRVTRVLYACDDRPADSNETQYEGAFISTDQSAHVCQHDSPPITAGADSPLLRTITPPPHLSLSSSTSSSSSGAGQTGAEMDLSQLRMAVDSLASAAQRSILSPKSTVFVPRFTA